jgi:phosphorylcholine metabolism protein LicD
MSRSIENFGKSNGFGEHKECAIDLLKKTVQILDANNIEYFLISGTLLGYCRHNDFIPWDDDIDIIASPKFIDIGSV